MRPVGRLSSEQGEEAAAQEEVELQEAQDRLRRVADAGEELEIGEEQREAERDPDLREHGVLRGAEKAPNLEVLLEPFEEQLDLPTLFVDGGDDVGGEMEDVGEEDVAPPGVGAGRWRIREVLGK